MSQINLVWGRGGNPEQGSKDYSPILKYIYSISILVVENTTNLIEKLQIYPKAKGKVIVTAKIKKNSTSCEFCRFVKKYRTINRK